MEKRGMLGSVEVDVQNYWTNGKGSQQLKCNETVLYADIDCEQAYVSIAKTQEEVQEHYSKMDMLYLCLQAVERFGLSESALRYAGVVIGNMLDEGAFSQTFASIDEENIYVETLVGEMAKRVEANGESGENKNFMEWYNPNVCDLNYYHNADGSKTVDKPRMMGVGATYTDDYWSKKIKKGGMYGLYLVTDTDGADGGLKKQIERKKIQQTKHLNYIHASANNMTLNSVLKNMEAGIIEDSGMSPSDCLGRLKKGGSATQTNGLGIVTIISAIVAAIVAIVKFVAELKAQKEAAKELAKQQAEEPTENQMNANKPDPSDWLKMAEEEEKAAEEAKKNAEKMQMQYEQMKEKQKEEEGKGVNPLVWIGGAGILGVIGIVIALVKKKKSKKGE